MQKLILFLGVFFMLALAQQGMAQEVLRVVHPYADGGRYVTINTDAESSGEQSPYNLMYTIVSTKTDTLQLFQKFQWRSMVGFFKHKIYAPYLQETPLDQIIIDDPVYSDSATVIPGYYAAKFIAHTPFADGEWILTKNDTLTSGTDTLFIRAQHHMPK